MGFRCKSCGGGILFDIESQGMKCQYCGSVFSAEDYRVNDRSAGTDIPEAGMTLFSCQSCGAELQGTEDSQVGFCPYCGGQSLLHSADNLKNRISRIIPFQITREQCAAQFEAHTKKIPYLPRAMRDASHLKSFTGIYMPYYEYDVELGASHIQGTKVVESNARYEVVNTYAIDARAEGNYCGVPFDASRYLDDEIAARTLPFDKRRERDFSPAYLSGFYADASTVPPETYEEDAARQASDDIVEEVAERVLSSSGIRVERDKSRVEARTRRFHRSLMPMWFLTWRRDDRVAYAVVNGESGKVVSDLPVDMKAFALGCVAIAAVLFALLELFVQPTPLITSVISLVAGILMAAAIRGGTKQLFEKQTHANDKGWNGGPEPAVQETGSVQKKKKKGLPGWFFWLIVLIASYYLITEMNLSAPKLAAVIAVVYLVLSLKKTADWQKSVPEKQPILAILLVLAAVAANAIIVFLSPVNDVWYYLGDAACILILILASAFMTQVYNIGTTRPLPKLFDREEVR